MKIKAFIINRNLLTTVKTTVEFLKKDERIEVWILDNGSTYPPLLEWYKTNPCNIHYFKRNAGAYCYWDGRENSFKNENFYIVTDGDCLYEDIPNDWLDRMLTVLNGSNVNKVGFSLDIFDLPDNKLKKDVLNYETQNWQNWDGWGWQSKIDTTFALYRPNSKFKYEATRLDKPYCIKHTPWYMDKISLSDEWKYYLDHINSQSFWGIQLIK